jgi:hypothetical protein
VIEEPYRKAWSMPMKLLEDGIMTVLDGLGVLPVCGEFTKFSNVAVNSAAARSTALVYGASSIFKYPHHSHAD